MEPGTSSPQSFYDELAASYHLIFADWEASLRRQGELLDALIRAELARDPQAVTVLDCACGIGTQAIGLGLQGYAVHATDLSPAAVERAGREAARLARRRDPRVKTNASGLGASITTGVADFRTLDAQVEGTFDVVIAFDNALPHLLADDDLRAAARAIAAKTRPGGLFMASIRDYDRLRAERPEFDGLRRLDGPDGQRIVFQAWDWDADGAAYTVNQFILRDVAGEWVTGHYQARYRALTRAELAGFMAGAGFVDLRWDMERFYQPVLIARRG